MKAARIWKTLRQPNLALRISFVFIVGALGISIGARLLASRLVFLNQNSRPRYNQLMQVADQLNQIHAERLVYALDDSTRHQYCENASLSAIIYSPDKDESFWCGPFVDEIRATYKDASVKNSAFVYKAIVNSKEVHVVPSYYVERERFNLYNMVFWSISLLVLGVLYFIVRWFVSPLKLMVSQFRSFGDGKLEIPKKIERSDEIGQISEAFVAMAKRISEVVETKEQLLIDISHEVRSPLTRMRLFLETLNADEKSKAPILHEISEIDRLVTLLMDGARFKHAEDQFYFTAVTLDELAGEIHNFVCEQSSRGVTIQWEDRLTSSQKKHRVFWDSRYFKIALQNLLNNAVKYTSKSRPVVHILLECDHETDDNFLRLTIRDFGPGVSPEFHHKIFKPFFRLDKARTPNKGGFGLGLNLVQRIIHGHHGKVFVDARITDGLAVVIELKLHKFAGMKE